MPRFSVLLRGSLVLLAVHTSTQWLLVEYFTKSTSLPVLMMLVFGTVATHVLVLLQRHATLALGVQYEEVLRSSRQLLRLPRANWPILLAFLLLQAAMAGTIIMKLLAGYARKPFVELGFLAGMAMHTKAMYDTCAGRQKWREPQLASQEVYGAAIEVMASTDTPVSLAPGQVKKLAHMWTITGSTSLIAFMLVARVMLDVLQLRGELVDYSVSRGKLAYMAGSHALHNTLLLDQNADSLMLNVQLGEFTHGVLIKTEHPLLPADDTALILNESGEQQISLPGGPLYSRLSLLAMGDYVNTTYIIHILRVGEAISVSLTSTFNAGKYPELKGSLFHEERRLQYQLEHRAWHVPDVDLANTTLLVKMTSLAYAPMIFGADGETATIPQLASECHCQPEIPGAEGHLECGCCMLLFWASGSGFRFLTLTISDLQVDRLYPPNTPSFTS